MRRGLLQSYIGMPAMRLHPAAFRGPSTLAWWRALALFAMAALLMQQLPVLPTSDDAMEAGRPATLAAPSIASATQTATSDAPRPSPKAVAEQLAARPLAFEANHGQADGSFDFVARGRGYAFGLAPSRMVLALRPATASRSEGDDLDPSGARVAGSRLVTIELEGARTDARGVPAGELPTTVNYILGNDPAKWRTGVPTYERIRYQGVYPGIDAVFYGSQRDLEFDFVVAPGVDPSVIALRVEGAERISMGAGVITLGLPGGDLILRAPHVYQEVDGARRTVASRYLLRPDGRIGFDLDPYDRSTTLVIDPVLTYSTYLGGTGEDYGLAIAVDPAGARFITGQTVSAGFPGTSGTFDITQNGAEDIFVSRIGPAGVLAWTTYIGGSASDFGFGVAVGNEAVHVTGRTHSADFPVTAGVVRSTFGGATDAFVLKLTLSGTTLTYSTYLGGSGQDEGNAIAVDFLGRAHVTGYTASSDFPLASAIRSNPNGTTDAFVTKLTADATGLVYSTYLGGEGPPATETSTPRGDHGLGIALDAQFNAYVVGYTDSTTFPTTAGAFRTTHQSVVNNDMSGYFDGFVTKLSPAGAMVYSTFLGGGRTDTAYAVAVDWAGNAYVVGGTASFDFPAVNAYQGAYRLGGDAFLTKLNAAGSAALYSTYLGGPNTFEGARGVAADQFGNAWVAGLTTSTDFPTVAPIQGTHGGSYDAFIAQFDTTRSGAGSLRFSTFYGGAGNEMALGVAMALDGNLSVTGWTHGTANLSTTVGAAQPSSGGSVDAFVLGIKANQLYAVESSGDGLSLVAPATGATTFVGRLDADTNKFTTPIAMAVRPSDRKLFAWTNSGPGGALLSIDPCSGQGTLVNASTPPQGQLGSLAFAPNGTLYGVDASLYTVDPSTGGKTLVGSVGLGNLIAAADFDPVSGILYGVELTPAGSTTPPRLVTIDTTSGAATVVASLSQDIGRVGSIVFLPSPKPGLWGRLMGSGFGGPLGNILFDIGPADGTVSSVRNVTGGFPPQGLGFSDPCLGPTWPGGATLTPFRVGPKLVGFSWPAVQGAGSYKVLIDGVVTATTAANVTSYRAGGLTSNTTYAFAVQACNANGCTPGPTLSVTTPIGLNNYTWSSAHPLTPGSPVSEHLFVQGLSAWFKFAVKPDQKVDVTLTGVPADYDLLLFKDIAAAYGASTSLAVQNAELLDSALIDSSLIDSALIDSALIDSALIDSALIDSSLIDSALIDSSLIDSALIDSSLIDSALIDSALIDSSLIDSSLIDSSLIDSALIDSSLIDSSLIDSSLIDSALIDRASSAVARRTVLARSANAGTASERIQRFTFDRSGDFYVRVRGKAGAFSLAAPFTVRVDVQTGLCEGISAVQTPSGGTVLGGVAGPYERVIVWDRSRMPGTEAEKDAVAARLGTYASAVGGVVVRVDLDARVGEAHRQADLNVACPYAKNLVAEEIKRIIDAYRHLNPVSDVVVVGSDAAIPFWRHVSPAFGTEAGYAPPTRHDSASEAALQKGLYLSQDRYGARVTIERLGYTVPLQDIGVSRVIESAAEVSAQLDAYALLTGGLIPMPSSPSALVTGYDFLIDFAQAVQQDLRAGLGSTAVVDDTLITDAWRTNDLREKLLVQRYDFLSIGGHFSAYSTIGPDYDPATKLRSADVLSSPVDMEWAISASPGCHCGYNVPDGEALVAPNVPLDPDWSQVAARKRFIYVCGTGYQYGETELVDYSERLYLGFWQQLRTGTGAVSVSQALLGAKKAYRLKPLSSDIHIKAMLQATLYGLPVRVDMPGARLPAQSDASIVSQVTAYTTGPGSALALSSADTGAIAFSISPTPNSAAVRLPDGTAATATYLLGSSGFISNPLEPMLPLELRNVSVPNTLLRGVGFRGGAYTDTSGVLPLTSTPGTELGAAMVPFVSDVFYPTRPWGANALETVSGGPVRLFVTPAQHRSATPGSTSIVRRQLNTASFRLFYSAHTGASAGSGAHAIEAVASTLQGGLAGFSVTVAGDPDVGVQEVWVTYTATSGPLAGVWQSFDLAKASSGPPPGRELWTGSLTLPAGQSSGDVLYFVQVANGLGIVSMTTNGGEHFRLGPPPAQAAASVALLSPATGVSGAFGGTVDASAVLTSGGSPVPNALVTFDLGGMRTRVATDAAGVASATLDLLRVPGQYALRATFGGSGSLIPGESGAVAVTIAKQSTSIALSPGTTASGQYSDPVAPILVATLRDGSAAQRALREETIHWTVTGNDDLGTARYYATTDITNDDGQAVLRIDAIPLPAGTYVVTAHFSGSIPQASGPPVVLSHALYQPATASGTLAVSAESAALSYTGDTIVALGSPLRAAATVTQAADDAPGDITTAWVQFDVKHEGALIASAVVPVPESGAVAASFSDLATNVYTIEVTLIGSGFFQAAPVSVLVAVYDPTAGYVTGGGWIDSPAGACRLTAACEGATGRATFGFVSKYKRGAATPSGQTQFQFKAGGLSFHGASYEWLVVSGARAQYKGSGTINGAGDYGFLLTAIDGQVAAGGGSDRFRIKIWDRTSGAIVYDNDTGAEDSDPTTVIQGGSIVIHKG